MRSSSATPRPGRLEFTTDAAKGVEHGLFQVIAVGTPPDEDGSADLRYVLAVARTIAHAHEPLYDRHHQVDRARRHGGQGARARSTTTLQERGASVEFDVVSNPEFLKEGAAIQDFMKPDRVVIGTDNPRTTELMRALYEPFTRKHDRFIVMDIRSSELTKYAANAMLATKISFMNELANIAERVGADIEKVRVGIGSDPRIGYSFIYPGAGYGGSCFPKDVQALVRSARDVGHRAGDPRGGRVGEQPRRRKLLVRQDAPSLRRQAQGQHDRAVGPRVQAEYRRHARSAVAHHHRAAVRRRARRCAPTIRWPAPKPSASTAIARELQALQERLRGGGGRRCAGHRHRVAGVPQPRLRAPEGSCCKSPVIFDGRNLYDPAHARAASGSPTTPSAAARRLRRLMHADGSMLIPVILSGGAGTRLWPLSRELYPKQLLPLMGERTMLQETVLRLQGLDAARAGRRVQRGAPLPGRRAAAADRHRRRAPSCSSRSAATPRRRSRWPRSPR